MLSIDSVQWRGVWNNWATVKTAKIAIRKFSENNSGYEFKEIKNEVDFFETQILGIIGKQEKNINNIQRSNFEEIRKNCVEI
jgi:hypothetical protein